MEIQQFLQLLDDTMLLVVYCTQDECGGGG